MGSSSTCFGFSAFSDFAGADELPPTSSVVAQSIMPAIINGGSSLGKKVGGVDYRGRPSWSNSICLPVEVSNMRVSPGLPQLICPSGPMSLRRSY